MSPMRLQELKLAVTSHLCEHGWSSFNGPALASRKYKTAVGDREAAVFLVDFGGDSTNFMLMGEYISEGRNQLEPHCLLIPKNADAEAVTQLSKQFAVNVDAVVAQTYAVRLLAHSQTHSTDRQN